MLFVFGRVDLIIACATWFILWQLQQATRRALLANLHLRGAVIGDALSYLGPVVVLVLLLRGGIKVSVAEAFYSMAGMAMLGAIVQTLQLRISLRGFHTPHRWLLDNMSLGAWSLGAGAVGMIRNQLAVWLLAALSGLASVASLQAAANIFMALNPILFSLANLIPQVTARAFDNGDKRSAWCVARPYIMIALPPTLVFNALTVVFSPFLLFVFYGEGSFYLKLGDLFPYLAIGSVAHIPTELIICYFLGIRETKLVLKANLVGMAALIVSVLPLVATIGALNGVCAAYAFSEVIRLAFTVRYLRRLIAGRPPRRPSLVTIRATSG
jgi:O-antigen/teichoic acid export membrane protein